MRVGLEHLLLILIVAFLLYSKEGFVGLKNVRLVRPVAKTKNDYYRPGLSPGGDLRSIRGMGLIDKIKILGKV